MNIYSWIQLIVFFAVAIVLVKPLGLYMARVYQGERTFLDPVVGPLERLLYRAFGIQADEEMNWKTYAIALMLMNGIGILVFYALQRFQGMLPFNPAGLGAVSPDSAWNSAVSFVANTDWQGYGGEVTFSYFTQMLGATAQNFISSAVGMAVLVALIRGIARHSATTLGSFWVDLTRTILYILLPLSFILTMICASQGVVQTFDQYRTVSLLQPTKDANGTPVTEQVIALGPTASQEGIKQIGADGGGFFNTNSAHPFENPTPLSGFFEMLAIFLIPAGLVYTYGKMINDTRQGWALLAVMTVIFAGFLWIAIASEQGGNPAFAQFGIDQQQTDINPGGNMEGKEVRFGIINSAIWATGVTAVANGSVNSMHDSFMPMGGLVPLFLMQLGEVIFGGVGVGLTGMLAFVIVGVFIAGLMVGRTPEYLGKKIEAYEMKMASLILLIPIVIAKTGTAIAVVIPAGLATIWNTGGPHGFSEVLYAFTSAAANNGSAFAGLGANTPFYNTALGIVIFLGRYWLIIPTLAIAGSLVKKKTAPVGAGTLPTHTPLFIIWMISVILIVGALSFIPALALGPIVEHLMIFGK